MERGGRGEMKREKRGIDGERGEEAEIKKVH